MKRSVTVVLACLLFPLCVSAQGSIPNNENQPHTISVMGEATVQVIPDRVVLSVGIESIDRSLAIARAANEKAIKKVLSAMRELNIPERNLNTDYISLSTQTHHDNDCDRQDGRERLMRCYVVRRTLTIDLRDVSKFDKVLSTALDAGVTDVHDIQFLTTEVRKYRDQARTMAIRAAREKANLFVREAGTEITSVISIKEEPDYGWTSFYGRWWGWRDRGSYSQMSQNAVSVDSASFAPGSSESFAPGQLAVTAKIAVTYALK
ncbi:MAG: SIMPL domain-containing protein [Zoogloeaceae bacterium]|jgi:uncharacterized protein YggE|nr:SIMPL domain-containing protein [Zoogloeaceae bacterium]